MKKVFMASVVLSFLSLTILLFQTVSCRKAAAQLDGASTKARGIYQVNGLWIGTYSVNGQPGWGNQYYSLVVKPDGTLIVDSKLGTQQHLSTGTWSLNDTTFNASFTCVYGADENVGITETITATWNSSGTLVGTWSNIPPLTGSGNITLERVN
ncbi:hypothetical protein A8C56_07020 [Niabella ginsenosidivorans]|uniref:Lipocalin-like domain-containing protein n=1 Tax=Niabella ginsenosidivorans TaxID=1176587 RepID=A0A1A9I2G3_9BACT|nr:hypothetical protein [Niabella ginsenosidivorans]ANH80764.1 hypothetical protein A8C56_07020 [Niabella ginsenosidivorans]